MESPVKRDIFAMIPRWNHAALLLAGAQVLPLIGNLCADRRVESASGLQSGTGAGRVGARWDGAEWGASDRTGAGRSKACFGFRVAGLGEGWGLNLLSARCVE